MEPVIVEAVRSPIGRRGGGLSSLHAAELLGQVMQACLARAAVEPSAVDQVIGGCVTAAGEQSINVTRTAWLTAGFGYDVAATTIDAQCGSSQQAVNLAAGLVASGAADAVLACGVETMTRVPLGTSTRSGPGRPYPRSLRDRYRLTDQFEGAELIAERWKVTREDADAFGVQSQQRARTAWNSGHFATEVHAIDAPDLLPAEPESAEAKDFTRRRPSGSTHRNDRDEGLRDTSAEALARLAPVREGGIHTAGTISQISDGAAAVLVMSAARAAELGVRVRARIVAQCLVGVDPVMMLTGPIDATRRIMERTGLALSDFDVIEVNEAFASVVLAWQREFGLTEQDMTRVNASGGAIALGHPVGSTGARLLTTALHALERMDAHRALVTMCCGGGLGTGTVLER